MSGYRNPEPEPVRHGFAEIADPGETVVKRDAVTRFFECIFGEERVRPKVDRIRNRTTDSVLDDPVTLVNVNDKPVRQNPGLRRPRPVQQFIHLLRRKLDRLFVYREIRPPVDRLRLPGYPQPPLHTGFARQIPPRLPLDILDINAASTIDLHQGPPVLAPYFDLAD